MGGSREIEEDRIRNEVGRMGGGGGGDDGSKIPCIFFVFYCGKMIQMYVCNATVIFIAPQIALPCWFSYFLLYYIFPCANYHLEGMYRYWNKYGSIYCVL